MDAVIDSSALISLSRAGLLHLVDRLPFSLFVMEVVWDEVVTAGLAAGYPDAAAVESALAGTRVRPSRHSGPADRAVLEASRRATLLLCNDQALGRRARNIGVRWLRTVDVVRVLHDLGLVSPTEARGAVVALRDALRITPALAREHLKEIK